MARNPNRLPNYGKANQFSAGSIGSVSAPAYTFDNDPDSGMYENIAGSSLDFALNGARIMFFSIGGVNVASGLNIAPQTNNSGSLGLGTLAWADLFLGDGAVINFNNGAITVTHSTNALSISGCTTISLGGTDLSNANNINILDTAVIRPNTAGLSNMGTAAIGWGLAYFSNASTEPASTADVAIIYCEDLSAGNATLGIATERAVAADAGVASTHSLTVRINQTSYRILLAT